AAFWLLTLHGRGSSIHHTRPLLSDLLDGRGISAYRERESVMRRLARLTAGGVLALVALNGCANMSLPACMATAALIGPAPGAVGGGVGTHNIEKGPTTNGQVAAGAAAGAVA